MLGANPGKKEKHYLGVDYITNTKQAIKRIAGIEGKQIKKETKQGLFIGGCQLSRRRETGHMIVNGLPGGGKTVLAKSILKQIIDNGDRAIIHDPKGDYTAFLPTESFALFAPWDDRTVWWDLSKDITNPQLAQTFAANLFGDGGKDPFWNNAARDLFAGVLTYLMKRQRQDIKAYKDKKITADQIRYWSWIDIAEILEADSNEFLRIANIGDPNSKKIAEPSRDGKEDKTVKSILATIGASVGWIVAYARSTKFDKKKAFSATRWLSKKDDRKILILQNNANYKSRAEQIFGNFLQAMSAYANSSSMPEVNESEQGIYMLLDEFPQLGKSVGEVAQTLMELGRSRGIRMIFMVQDLSQLEQVLGKDRGDVMRSLQQTRIWCKSSSESAKRSSDLFGNKEVIRMIENVDENDKAKTSQTIVSKKVITEEAFTGLEILDNGAEVILAIDDALVKTVVPFTEMPDIRPKVVESNSWKFGMLDIEFDEHAGKQKDDVIRLPDEEKADSDIDFWKSFVK